MKKILYIVVCALCLASCENFFLEHQLGYEPSITVVRNFSYALTDADYATIASNKTNVQTALDMGEFEGDSSIYYALQEISTGKYFEGVIAPEVFLPAFMAAKYPQYSDGTMCEVTYRAAADVPSYFADFRTVEGFTPAEQLTSKQNIVAAMENEIQNPQNGTIYVVNYSNDLTYVYQYKNDKFSEYSSKLITPVALAMSDYAEMGMERIGEPERILSIWLSRHYPYAEEDTKYLVLYQNADGVYAFAEFTYNAEKWNIWNNVTTESMSFEMKDVWKANISTYLSEPFIDHGQGNFVVQNVVLQSPLTYVWYYSASYGMCASAYKSGASYDSEAWLVSPLVKLKAAKHPQLIFDQAFNKAPNFTEEATVLVSTDYKGDVTTATWTPLEWTTNEDGTLNVPAGGTWDFQTSGNLDLTAFAGQFVYIAFRYTTSGGISGTWEIKNVLVYEPEAEE